MQDLFDFWSELPEGETVHPRDVPFLRHATEDFCSAAPPGHINGPLRTAPVVLCYGNPGLDDMDRKMFLQEDKRAMLFRQMSGLEPYPEPWLTWLRQRCGHLKLADDMLRRTVAVFNVVPYTSVDMNDAQERLAFGLPSVWVAQHYLRTVLMPQAARREIFLVVARKHSLWGIAPGHELPNFRQVRNRGGYLGEALSRDIVDWLATRR